MRLALGAPVITPEKIGRLSVLLKDKLYNGTPELKQAYARLKQQEVRVRDDEIRKAAQNPCLRAVPRRASAPPRREFSLLFRNGAPYMIKERTPMPLKLHDVGHDRAPALEV